jgi:SAM-dependent methyltransferase
MQLKNYEHARLRKLARLCKPGAVLDLGYAQLPNPYFIGLHRVGVDLNESPAAVDYEETIVGNAMNLEDALGDRQFENVVAGEFLEHFEDPYLFLRKLRKHIKPSGHLILSTPNPVGFPLAFFEVLRIKSFFYTKHHTYLYPPRWVERMLEETGYRVEKVTGVGVWMPVITPPCPASISYQVIYVASPAE